MQSTTSAALHAGGYGSNYAFPVVHLHISMLQPRTNDTRCSFRGQRISANLFCAKFFENHSGHGRLHRKSWMRTPKSVLSCGPNDGEKLFELWAFRRKDQEFPQDSLSGPLQLRVRSITAENRSPYCVFVSLLFSMRFRHYSTTIVR